MRWTIRTSTSGGIIHNEATWKKFLSRHPLHHSNAASRDSELSQLLHLRLEKPKTFVGVMSRPVATKKCVSGTTLLLHAAALRAEASFLHVLCRTPDSIRSSAHAP